MFSSSPDAWVEHLEADDPGEVPHGVLRQLKPAHALVQQRPGAAVPHLQGTVRIRGRQGPVHEPHHHGPGRHLPAGVHLRRAQRPGAALLRRQHAVHGRHQQGGHGGRGQVRRGDHDRARQAPEPGGPSVGHGRGILRRPRALAAGAAFRRHPERRVRAAARTTIASTRKGRCAATAIPAGTAPLPWWNSVRRIWRISAKTRCRISRNARTPRWTTRRCTTNAIRSRSPRACASTRRSTASTA